VCDGFESGSIDTTLWTKTTNDASQTITVDTANPHHGAYSLHAHWNAVASTIYDAAEVREAVATGNGPLYFRVWYFITALPGPDVTLLELHGSAAGQGASGGLGFESGNPAPLDDGISNTVGNTYDYKKTSATTMPLGTWTCLELMVDTRYLAPNTNGLLEEWKDTSSSSGNLTDLTGTAKLDSIVSTSFGINLTSPSVAFDLYLDDIAVDTQFIPCNQ
jgi:hypothetical protein